MVVEETYFLLALTLAIIKTISAIKPITNNMPQIIPALKIPFTSEQLLNPIIMVK
jgi:hypothetical protein